MNTKALRSPSSIRPIVTLKSPLDSSSISYNVVLTTNSQCCHSIIADIGVKSQVSPIHHIDYPNHTIQKKKEKQWQRKLRLFGSARGLKSAVSLVLKKANTVLHAQLSNGVFGVTRGGNEMECIEPYFSVPVVPVMATH